MVAGADQHFSRAFRKGYEAGLHPVCAIAFADAGNLNECRRSHRREHIFVRTLVVESRMGVGREPAWLTRSSRWQWINSTGVTEYAAETILQVVDGDHLVFSGITPVGGQVDVIDGTVNSGQAAFINTSDVGNGTLIAQRADNSYIWIAEWATDVNFYIGTEQNPGGYRMPRC